MKNFKIAGAALLATTGLAITTAQADSYLAPLVVSNSTTDTYFAFKMRGAGVADEFTVNGGSNTNGSRIHYYHIQKFNDAGTAPVEGLADLRKNPLGGCRVTNTTGHGSSWDVVYQDVRKADPLDSRADFAFPLGETLINDASMPEGWLGTAAATPFVGMVVLDDVGNKNIEPSNGRRVNEGDMSGFAYIVNSGTGTMVDYKFLNNPFSKRTGDFKTNWISKTSIDWMWLPANGGGVYPNAPERTSWYTAVTGEGMTLLAEQQGKWDESVVFTQTLASYADAKDIRPIFSKTQLPAPGAYNNDEQVLSGPKDYKITCLGLYDRTDILTNQQVLQSTNGGWKRSHIVPVNASGVDNVKAHGAITYRIDLLGSPSVAYNPTFTVETSGHLSTSKNKTHPNRGY